MLLLEPLTQHEKSPAEGEEAYPQGKIQHVHPLSPSARHKSVVNGNKMDIKKGLRLRARTSRLCKNRSCWCMRSVTECTPSLQQGEPETFEGIHVSAAATGEGTRAPPRQ